MKTKQQELSRRISELTKAKMGRPRGPSKTVDAMPYAIAARITSEQARRFAALPGKNSGEKLRALIDSLPPSAKNMRVVDF